MILNNFFRQSQPQPCAVFIARFVSPEKRIKNPVNNIFWNADATVAEGYYIFI